jgi:hypothetical protein
LSLNFGVSSFFGSAGHTSGLVVTADGVFHPIWQDNRTGISQLWTASVTVRGAAVKHGAEELASLTEATDRVTFDLTQVTYDRTKGIITAQMRLKNTSKDTIYAPVKARVTSLESDLGVAQLIGAENGMTGAGAIYDLSDMLSDKQLLPDSSSHDRTLSIRVSDVRQPGRRGGQYHFGLAAIDARLYVGSLKGPEKTTAAK